MQSTTSVHWNKGTVARAHNERDRDLCEHESHIDIDNVHGSSFHEVWMRTDLTAAYEDIFGDAIASYNGKQKRADRQLSVEDYMQSIVDDTRGKRQTKKENGKAVVDENARQGKQLSYELTIKVGNTDREKDEQGRVMYDSSGHHIRPQALPIEITKRAQKRYVETFQQANPNLRLINADYHADEGFYNRKGVWEYSTDHTHIEVVPVASGFKRGLEMQNSMNKAMAEMGFDTPDCYALWAKREQERLEKIVQEEYDAYCKTHPDFAKEHGSLEIVHPVNERTKQGGASKEEFALEQELDEAIHEAEVIKRTFLNGCKRNKEYEQELQARENDIQAQREALQVQKDKYTEITQKAQNELNKGLQMQKDAEELKQELQARDDLRRQNEADAREYKEQALQALGDASQILASARALPTFDSNNIYITQRKENGSYTPPMHIKDFNEKHKKLQKQIQATVSMCNDMENAGCDNRQMT